jgi:hydroxyacylglutathione hydrolase
MFTQRIYDEKLAQAAYLIGCQQSGAAIVIDPERDVDRYLRIAAENGLRIIAAAETHIHADFLSGTRELAERTGARVYLSGEGGPEWQYEWPSKRPGGGEYAHQRLRDGDSFAIGQVRLTVLHTPGHTPEHIAFLVTDQAVGADAPLAMVSGDFLFVGDVGRPDLLETAVGRAGAGEPAARALYGSIQKLGSLADFIQLWPGHGAESVCGKALGAVPTSTIGYEKRFNPALRAAAADETSFVAFILAGQPEPPIYFARMKRDNRLGPALLGELPSPVRLTPRHLAELDGRSVAIVDTRPWEMFRRGHVPGSLFLPLARSFTTDAGSLVPEGEDICLIVEGARLEEAVRDLVRVGLDRVTAWYPAEEWSQCAGLGAELASLPEVSASEARDLLAHNRARVLDVRRATEFAAGHLPGAINIAHTRLAACLADVPRAAPWIVNCQGGGRSARACALLRRNGYEVMNLKGGFMAW